MKESNQTDQTTIDKNSDKNSKPSNPTAGETGQGLKKAGEFKGDLRDLPKTKPADQDRPRREDPPFKPVPAPTPAAKPPDD